MKHISAKAHRILNDPELVRIQQAGYDMLDALLEGKEAEHPFLREYTPSICGYNGRSGFDLSPEKEPLAYTDPESWVIECLEDMASYAEKRERKPWFEPFCLEFGIFGVHFIDRIFGAAPFYHPPGQWDVKQLAMHVGSLAYPDWENSEAWRLAETAARTFAAQEVALPAFGLPTIASALNIGTNLFGSELLMAMVEEPESAAHDLKVINDVLIAIHRKFRALLPSAQIKPVGSMFRTLPDGYGQLCGCSCQLLSGDLYREMVAPLDAALLDVFPKGGMIHLCGSHTQHLDTWVNMPQLRVYQIGRFDFEEYAARKRADQLLYFFPADERKNEFPCMELVDYAMSVTGGERMVIMSAVPPQKKRSK
ncbi:MAG: hypothetical protein ACI4ME_00390 [Aristaeellaceae bacterium]